MAAPAGLDAEYMDQPFGLYSSWGGQGATFVRVAGDCSADSGRTMSVSPSHISI